MLFGRVCRHPPGREARDTVVVVANVQLKREIETRLIEASFEVAPEMSDTERVAFVRNMMASLSVDDAAAILDI